MSSDEWVKVGEVFGELAGEQARALLESVGIACQTFQESAGRVLLGATFGPFGQVDIFVPAAQAEAARQLLEDYNAGVLDDGDALLPED
ncbi:MAG: hypothetical protein OHK0052_25870 [Anaerolineales bacterium]